MSHLQDPNPKSFRYTKNFHTKSSLDVDAIKARNLIKSKALPKFDIVSEDFNAFTVALVHYEKNGLQEIFNDMEDNNLFQKHILSVFHASLLIQNLFGKFFLTDDKIRADREGNVVLWFNKNYELSIPFLSRKKTIQAVQYKRKFHEYLSKIRWILKKKVTEKSPGERFLDFDQNLDFIKKSLQFQDLDKMTIQLNMQIQKYQSEFNNMKEYNFRNQTIISAPYLSPYQNESRNINPFKKGQNSKFYSKTQKKPENATQILNLKCFKSQVNNFQYVVGKQALTNSIESNSQLYKQTQIPKQIKQQFPSLQKHLNLPNTDIQQLPKKSTMKTVKSSQLFPIPTLTLSIPCPQQTDEN